MVSKDFEIDVWNIYCNIQKTIQAVHYIKLIRCGVSFGGLTKLSVLVPWGPQCPALHTMPQLTPTYCVKSHNTYHNVTFREFDYVILF